MDEERKEVNQILVEEKTVTKYTCKKCKKPYHTASKRPYHDKYCMTCWPIEDKASWNKYLTEQSMTAETHLGREKR